MTERPRVVVVGAGPVGVAASILLARNGIESIVLERHAQPYPLPRAVHADDEVFRILAAIGVADKFAAISRPMPGMRLLDARHHTIAEFRRDDAADPDGYPQANMFDQPDLEQVLLTELAAHPEISLRRGCEVTSVEQLGPRSARVRYRDTDGEHELVADAVLGCDGANSMVRTAIGTRVRDLHFDEQWLIIDMRSPRPLGVWGGVHQICDPARAATFMHVTGDRYRWEFRLDRGETAEILCAPDCLAALLAPWTTDVSLDELELVRHATYTFRARVAERWQSGRIFLLGDAAHQTPPFIGQGLGAGLRDAYNLTWKLARVLRGEAREAILATYEQERRPHVTTVIRLAIMVGWALTGGKGRAAIVRRVLVAGLCRVPGFTQAVLNTTSPPMKRGELVRRRTPLDRRPGHLCPQHLDDLLGSEFALVTVGPLPCHARDAASRSGIRHELRP